MAHNHLLFMPRVPDLHRYPALDWDRLSVVPQEHRKQNLEHDPNLPGTEAQALMDMRIKFEQQLALKVRSRLEGGAHDEEAVKKLLELNELYHARFQSLLLQFPEYADRISRRNISIEPPRAPNGKFNLGHKFPVFTAAMWSVWPGDSREHRAFLASHNAKYRTPESVASKGAVFVTPPRLPASEVIDLLEHLHGCHPNWRNPPTVTQNDTCKDAKTLLAHYDEDFVAVVLDEGGQCIGTVDPTLLHQSSGQESIMMCLVKKNGHELPLQIDPEDAYLHMTNPQTQSSFAMNFETGKPLMMTRKTAAAAKLMPAFMQEKAEGFGCLVYVGVDNVEETLKFLREIAPHKPAGIIIEAAHGHRTDVVYNAIARIREEFPGLFIATGTTTNPKGILEMSRFVDAIKLGISNGGYCLTKNTGVELPDATIALECGAAAKGVVSVIVDNLGSVRRAVKILTVDECIGAQGGGSLIARRDSSNKIITRDGVEGKTGNGEASLNAVWRNMGEKVTVEQMMQKELGLHSEGESDRWQPLRSPSTYGEFFSQLGSHLRSQLSYSSVSSLAEGQEKTTLRVVEPID